MLTTLARPIWLRGAAMLLVLGITLGLVSCRRRSSAPPPAVIGQEFSIPVVSGWLNGSPQPAAGRDQILVVHAWAYWCRPCLAELPQLATLQRSLADAPVQFVGLTAESDESLEETRLALARAKITWPNGYGAAATLQALGVNSLPTLLVVGRDNRISWVGTDVASLQRAVEAALTPPQSGEPVAGH